jgi:biopolymer transport protein ExbD
MPLVLTRRLQPLHGVIDLLSSSFVLQPGIQVDPPKMAYWSGTPSSRLIVAVTMSPPQVDANGAPLPEHPVMYFNDQIVTLDTLGKQLDSLHVGRDTRTLVLKADKNVPFNVLNDIMETAFAHRLSIHLAGQPTGP